VHHAVVGGDLDRDLFADFESVISILTTLSPSAGPCATSPAGSAELHAASPSMSPATLSIMNGWAL